MVPSGIAIVTVQEGALLQNKTGGLHPARPEWRPPTKSSWTTCEALFALGETNVSRQEGVPLRLHTALAVEGTLAVHRTSWRIPFWRHTGASVLVLEFRGAWVLHSRLPVAKPRRP